MPLRLERGRVRDRLTVSENPNAYALKFDSKSRIRSQCFAHVVLDINICKMCHPDLHFVSHPSTLPILKEAKLFSLGAEKSN